MLGGIASVHPEPCGIQGFSCLHHFSYIVAFTAFVSGTPKQHTGVVPVAQDHPAHPLAIHFGEFGHIADVLRSVGFITGLVDDKYAIFICQVQIFIYGRVVRGAHPVEIELFEYLEIFTDHIRGHGMAHIRMLHMRIDGAHFQRLAVQVEHAFADFGFLESHPFGNGVHNLPGSVGEFHFQVIEDRSLGGPFLRSGHLLSEPYGLQAFPPDSKGLTGHGGDLASVLGHRCIELVAILVNIVSFDIYLQRQVRIHIIGLEVRDHLPVKDTRLRRGVYRHVIEDTGKTPVVLALEVIAVTVFHHHHGQGVVPRLDVLRDIVFRGLLGAFVISHLPAVHPYERAGGHFLETEEHLFTLPGRRYVECGTVCTGGVEVHRDIGQLHCKRIGRASAAKTVACNLFLLLRGIGILQCAAVLRQEGFRHSHYERGAYIAEYRLTESLHFPVGRHFDQGPFARVERRLEEVLGHVIWRLEVLETPFAVQGYALCGDMICPSGFLPNLEHSEVLQIVREVLQEWFVLRR